MINKICSLENTNKAKKSLIERRTGLDWELTTDTIGFAGELQAEYILDGRTMKVGSEDSAKANKAIANNLVSTAGCLTYNVKIWY